MQVFINTGAFILTSFALNVFLILMLSVYQLHKKKEKNIKMFMMAKVFQASAFAVWYITTYVPFPQAVPFFQFAGSELMLMAVFFECLAGIMLLDAANKKTFKVFGALFCGFSAAFIFAFFLDTTQNFRIIVFSAASSALIIYPLILLFRWKMEIKIHRMVGSIYFLMLAEFVLRALVAGGLITQDAALQDKMQSYILFSLFMLMILSNSGYLFLFKVRADIKLMQLANCDELTNILNRRAFIEISQKAIRYCARKGEPVSFAIFDIDNFKKVNDSFGHYVGDTVLVQIASMVQAQIRAYDFFGRYGGDEFALFLPGTSETEAYAAAQRMLITVEGRNAYNHTKLRVTLSMGLVTVVPSSDTSMETLYQLGDDALYDAKMSGGNCIMRPVQTVRAGGSNGETG